MFAKSVFLNKREDMGPKEAVLTECIYQMSQNSTFERQDG